MQEVKKRFPNLYDNVCDKFQHYDDEDMMLRKQFVGNIPYLKSVSFEMVNKIVTLMRTRKFLYGNNVLAHGNYSKYIMIIMDGQLQVRVQRGDYLNNKEEMDIWFASLEIGACFNVYNCFSKHRTTRVTYITSSKSATIGLIKVSDLKAMA